MSKLDDPNNKSKLDYIINMHLPIIHAMAKRLKNKGWVPEHVDHEDLIMPGIHGLMHAVATYNPDIASRKMRDTDYNTFLKYATQHIDGRMKSHARNNHVIDRHLQNKAEELARQNASATNTMQTPPQNADVPELSDDVKNLIFGNNDKTAPTPTPEVSTTKPEKVG